MMDVKKDMLLVLDAGSAAAFNSGDMPLVIPEDFDVEEILSDLNKIKVISIEETSDIVFLDENGTPTEPQVRGLYLKAKYIGEKNVFYEASFESINRNARDRLAAYKHLAHILGVTAMEKIAIVDSEKNSLTNFGAGLGGGGRKDQNDGNGKGTNAVNAGLSVDVHKVIAQRVNQSSLEFENFKPIEMTQERWNEAEKFLKDNGLYYVEDFRSLLNSRNPKDGLKELDLLQYQSSSDMSNILNVSISLDIAKAACGFNPATRVLSKFFKLSFEIDVNVKRTVQEFRNENTLFAMGFDGVELTKEVMQKMKDHVESMRSTFGEFRIRDAVEKMVEEKMSAKTIAKVFNMPEEEVKKMIEQNEAEKEKAKPNNNGNK